MDVTMALIGSRGDVQPGLAVAWALRDAGHHVRLGTSPNLVELVRRAGLTAESLGIDTGELLASPVVRQDMRSPHPVTRVRALRAVATDGWPLLTEGLQELSRGADVVVTGPVGQEAGAAVAEARDLRFAALHLCPLRTNGVVPLSPGLARLPRGPVVRMVWRAGAGVRHVLTASEERAVRAGLGLSTPRGSFEARQRRAGAVEVQCYDPVLVPGLAEEWPTRRPLVGFVDVTGDRRTPLVEPLADDVAQWLDAGEPPVYVGFGSMPVPDPQQLLTTFRSAARDVGRRILLAAGWSDFEPTLDDDVCVVRSIDHAQVLPRCVAAVHHGGAGTTAAALRAGIPSLVCAFSADQPMWAALLRARGIGVGERISRLDRDVLRESLHHLLDDATLQRARALSTQVVPADVAATSAARAVVD